MPAAVVLSLLATGRIAADFEGQHIKISDDAISRSSILRTVCGDVQEGERVPIPADEEGLRQWLSTVRAITEDQCQILLRDRSLVDIQQLAQVADGLGDPIGIAAACNEICARLFSPTRSLRPRGPDTLRLLPEEVLSGLSTGLQMRVMHAAPSLPALLQATPPHMHATALCAQIRTIDATAALQVPHSWAGSPAWDPGVAAVAHLTRLTRLSAAVTTKGTPAAASATAAAAGHLLHTVSCLRRLRNLTICGLQLHDADVHMQLAACMAQLPALTALRLSGSTPGGDPLQHALQACTGLVSLSLASLAFPRDGTHAAAVAAALRAMPALRTLDLSHTGLTQHMWDVLWPPVHALPHISVLNLSNNQLCAVLSGGLLLGGSSGGSAGSATLQVIDLSSNRLGVYGSHSSARQSDTESSGAAGGFKFLSGAVPVLSGQTALTRLELALTHAFSCSHGRLAEALCSCAHLQILSLQKSGIGAAAVRELAHAIPSLQALRVLDVYGNELRDKGAAALSDHLTALCALRVLNLGHNEISDEGAERVSGAAAELSELRRLHVEINDIQDAGARALCAALPRMPSLRHVSLFSNKFGAASMEALEAAGRRHGVQVLAGCAR